LPTGVVPGIITVIGGLVDCPRCHNEIAETVVECPHCHIVVAQYVKRRREMASGVATPGDPAPVEAVKKGPSLWILVLLLAVVAGYLLLHFNRHKPGPQPAAAVAPAAPNAPETTAPAPSSDAPGTPEAPSDETPPQDSSVTDESNDSNASAESFNKGDQKVKKLLHATAPLRIGNPEKVLEDK
jgi:hypothetical protein